MAPTTARTALPIPSQTLPEPRTPKKGRRRINDLDLAQWKQYDDILTDSLWRIPERDRRGTHSGDYHGNFVPQIPYQMMTRFTKRGDVVLDVFLGSGTTLIEARRMGRHGIGIELQDEVAAMARQRIRSTETVHDDASSTIIVEDSASLRAQVKVRTALAEMGRENLQLIVAHPPYHDIIRFSDRSEDLSNATDTAGFCDMYARVLDNFLPLLEKGRHIVLVIGDKYTDGEWIPLGFRLMDETLNRGTNLKSLIVKDMCGNRAKRNMENLWRYRALYGGFYVFKHEYVMLFRKK